jgi:glycosyltransferase involved in cell wall biosynthesis
VQMKASIDTRQDLDSVAAGTSDPARQLFSSEPASPGSEQPGLRIALLSYRSDPRVGGQGVFTSNIARSLAARGHRVTILSGPPYPDVPDGVALQELPSLDLFAQPLLGRYALRPRHLKSWTDTAEYFGHVSGKFMEPWSFGRRAAKWLRAHADDFDVVLDNQCLATGLLDIERHLPVVAVIHHPIRRDLEMQLAAEPDWKKRLLTRRWYGFVPMQERVARGLRNVVTVSSASARDIAQCMGVEKACIRVVPLGVDQAMFAPRAEVLDPQPLRIVTTSSSDVPLKGLRHLLAAFEALVPEWPELELVVVGKPREGPTRALARKLEQQGRLRFVSGLTNPELADLYASATLCVTPSLYEGFGLPAIEAMACGTPVVVTDGGALPEVVGDAGMIVRAGCGDALRMAIDGLLRDSEQRASMAIAGLARVRERYCWERVGEAYEGLLREAIAARC